MSLVTFEVNWTIPIDVFNARGYVTSTAFCPPPELDHLLKFRLGIDFTRSLSLICSSLEDCKIGIHIKVNINNTKEQGKFLSCFVLICITNLYHYKAPAAPRQRFALAHPSPALSSVGY